MRKHYRIDKTPDYRKVRVEVLLASLLIIGLVVGAAYVIFDINRSSVVIDDSKNKAILGTVEADDRFRTVENEFYKVKIISEWKQINNPEVIINGKKFYPDRYQGIEGDNVGRRLDVYKDEIPSQLGVDKVVSVTGVASKIVPNETSPQCYKFTEFPDVESGDEHPSTWNNIDFTCMTSEITNVLGAIEGTQRDGVVLDSSNGSTKYFLVYTDHGSRLDNSIFYRILESFVSK